MDFPQLINKMNIWFPKKNGSIDHDNHINILTQVDMRV